MLPIGVGAHARAVTTVADRSCPFCDPPDVRVFHRTGAILALWDAFPSSPGHALLVPRRHVASWFDLTGEEHSALVEGLSVARAEVLRRWQPQGFNLGVNDGVVAGQTVEHVHMHLIPRYPGDQTDPRGGVRWVLPATAAYWKGADDA